jgi:lysozyme
MVQMSGLIRPDLKLSECLRIGTTYGVTAPFLLGVRGFGEAENRINVYDDAIAIVDSNRIITFNANTDPSIEKYGEATLAPGVWSYRLGTHHGKVESYEALIQAGPVTVFRDEIGNDSGFFGINIHKGGVHTTGSEGCQTIPPDQWEQFISSVKTTMSATGLVIIKYLLTERS